MDLITDQNFCIHKYRETEKIRESPSVVLYNCITCNKEKRIVSPGDKPKIFSEEDLNSFQNILNDKMLLYAMICIR